MTYIFYGRVLPERVNFTLYPPIKMESEEFQLIVGSLFSRITVECESKDASLNLATLKNRVESSVRMIVDAFGYSVACGYDVEIESVYDYSNKAITVFGVQEQIFDSEEDIGLIRDGSPPSLLIIDRKDISELMGTDIPLRLAMADFRESIRNPDTTAFHCMRAIESLKHSDFLDSPDSSQKLHQLRKSIKLGRNTLNKVSLPGKDQRHGKSVPQTWEHRKEQMQITWEVIRRYLLLRLKREELDKLVEF